ARRPPTPRALSAREARTSVLRRALARRLGIVAHLAVGGGEHDPHVAPLLRLPLAGAVDLVERRVDVGAAAVRPVHLVHRELGQHAAVAVLTVAARPSDPAVPPAAAAPDAAHAVLDVASDDPPRRVLGLLERLAVVVGAPALGVIVAVRERTLGPVLRLRLRRRVER